MNQLNNFKSHNLKPKLFTNKEAARAIAVGTLFTAFMAAAAYGQTGAVNSDGVNLRTAGNPDSSISGVINSGESVTITSLVGDYYQVSYNGRSDLYIHIGYVDIPDMAVTVPVDEIATESSSDAEEIGAARSEMYALVRSGDGINIRSDANTDASIIATVPDQTAIKVVESWDNWTKVAYDGETGYVKNDYVELKKGVIPEAQAAVASSKGSQVIAYAKKFLGTPYRWGGTNLNRGVDCSGFVYSVYRNFGVSLNRSSSSMSSNGTRVSKANLKTGDLVFFDTSGRNNGAISHVGIYIGDGNFIHSSSGSSYCVTISSLSEAYYVRTYVTATRVIS
ncbi:MAG: C40 family peptidase [Clostridiales bacterium]|jgi:cell wall-associated NlpC family hydrolase|nr:C40 family peptidase [Clostridiales bacterium]